MFENQFAMRCPPYPDGKKGIWDQNSQVMQQNEWTAGPYQLVYANRDESYQTLSSFDVRRAMATALSKTIRHGLVPILSPLSLFPLHPILFHQDPSL